MLDDILDLVREDAVRDMGEPSSATVTSAASAGLLSTREATGSYSASSSALVSEMTGMQSAAALGAPLETHTFAGLDEPPLESSSASMLESPSYLFAEALAQVDIAA